MDLGQGPGEPSAVAEARDKGTSLSAYSVHSVISAAEHSSVIEQWCCLAVDGEHARALQVWHTCCFSMNTSMVAIVSVYGWSISEIWWPFIIPACSLTLLNTVVIACYLILGPVRAHSSRLWQLVGPIAAPQLMYITLMPIFSAVSKVGFSSMQLLPG